MKFTFSIAISSIFWTAFSAINPASAQPDNAWYPICVRAPAEITHANKATIKSDDCMQRGEQFVYQEKPYSGNSYRFRDGEVIKYFIRECVDRFGPCAVKFSKNSHEWSDGIWGLPASSIHKCGYYHCNWYTVRDSYGKLVLAIGMSY